MKTKGVERYGMVWNELVWGGMVWYGMVWDGMEWCGMVWYGMVWYGMVWYGMAWYGVVWYGMVWCGMVWYGFRYVTKGVDGRVLPRVTAVMRRRIKERYLNRLFQGSRPWDLSKNDALDLSAFLVLSRTPGTPWSPSYGRFTFPNRFCLQSFCFMKSKPNQALEPL